MRSLLAAMAGALLLMLPSSVQAQSRYSLSDFLGVWYGENEVVPAGERRVVPVRIEITEVPPARLGAPRRFDAHLVVRCIDRPGETCDLGVARVEAIPGNNFQLAVRMAGRRTSPLDFCSFTLILTSGTFDDGVTYTRFRESGLMYSVSPPRGVCRPSQFSGIRRSSGFVNRTPARLELAPGVRPLPLPRQPVPLPSPLPPPKQ